MSISEFNVGNRV